METLEALSERLRTIRDIRAIVRTMKTLSAVSIRQYEHAEAAMADYARTIELGLMALLGRQRAEGRQIAPVATTGQGGHGLLVIGSDRGLCGGYNDRIARLARLRLKDRPTVLGVVGARLAARLEAEGHGIDSFHTLPGAVEGLTGLVQAIVVDMDRWMHRHGVSQVWLLHNRRAGQSVASPHALRLLPLPEGHAEALSKADWPGASLPDFRMPPDRLMSWLVQEHLFVTIYRALAEALASEHAARLAAMQAAERNIADRGDTLAQLFRQRRQEAITSDLMDLLAGYEAGMAEDPPAEG